MLIVVVVLGILAVVVLPGAGVQQEHRARSAARLLIADIAYAQVLSINRSADPCVLVLRPGDDGYHIARLSDPGAPIEDPAGAGPLSTVFGYGRADSLAEVAVDSTTGVSGGVIAFTGLGALAQGGDASITLGVHSEFITVVIDASTGDALLQTP